jgi:hypothetical protein
MRKYLLLFITSFLFTGCSKLFYFFGHYPKDAFVSKGNIHYQEGNIGFVIKVQNAYPKALSTVRTTHYALFRYAPDIYICIDKPCYDTYAIIPQAGAQTLALGDAIVINGAKLMRNNQLEKILAHELSHFYWFSNGVYCQARWWEEGMAVFGSNGGGAGTISTQEAIEAIEKGDVFYPETTSSCALFGRDLASKYHISWTMYYKQAGMFVAYLHEKNPEAFKKTLKMLLQTKSIEESIQSVYGVSVEKLWREWRKSFAPPL